MAVRCSSCDRSLDDVLFEGDRWVLCDCGTPVSNSTIHSKADQEGREKMRRLARLADQVCCHILDENYPDLDIAVERSQLRQTALELFPDCESLFEMIYESRFDRLWEQWRVAR